MRVSTSERKRQKPVRYVFRCALCTPAVVVSMQDARFMYGWVEHDVLEFARGDVRLRLHVVHAVARLLRELRLGRDAPHALHRVHEQDRDESACACACACAWRCACACIWVRECE